MPTKKEKPHNDGKWTPSRFSSFVKSALRQASQRWPPKHAALAAARVERGKYQCAICKRIGPKTLPPKPGNKRRRNNATVDHISPVVPITGFTSWDDIINRMFCEVDGFQVLCADCHDQKTAEEREQRKEHKDANKES